MTTISTSLLSFCPPNTDFLGPLIFFENVKKPLLKLLFMKMAPICGPILMSHMGLLIEPKKTPRIFACAALLGLLGQAPPNQIRLRPVHNSVQFWWKLLDGMDIASM